MLTQIQWEMMEEAIKQHEEAAAKESNGAQIMGPRDYAIFCAGKSKAFELCRRLLNQCQERRKRDEATSLLSVRN